MMKRTLLALALSLVTLSAQAAGFRLSSPDFRHNTTIPLQHVFNGFGCAGTNISPALRWKNPPKGTKSFALLVHDPDAPTGGSGWWHWVVINLPADVRELPADAGRTDGSGLPTGAVQIGTDFGSPGWGGPCPPPGDTPHRYRFTLHALKVEKLELPPSATAALAGYMINANSLGAARLTGLYGRKK